MIGVQRDGGRVPDDDSVGADGTPAGLLMEHASPGASAFLHLSSLWPTLFHALPTRTVGDAGRDEEVSVDPLLHWTPF